MKKLIALVLALAMALGLFSFASAVVGAIVFLPRLATLVRGS